MEKNIRRQSRKGRIFSAISTWPQWRDQPQKQCQICCQDRKGCRRSVACQRLQGMWYIIPAKIQWQKVLYQCVQCQTQIQKTKTEKKQHKNIMLILDHFVSSGTTAYASKTENRRYIGIDIMEEYCKMAKTRIKQMLLVFWNAISRLTTTFYFSSPLYAKPTFHVWQTVNYVTLHANVGSYIPLKRIKYAGICMMNAETTEYAYTVAGIR